MRADGARATAALLSPHQRLATIGVIIGVSHLGLRAISPMFPYEASPPIGATVIVCAALMIAGGAFFALLGQLGRLRPSRSSLALMIGVGFAFRIVYFGSTPILEDDWRRYLWDGAVVARGIDPYAFPPAAAFAFGIDGSIRPPADDERLAAFRALGDERQAHLDTVSYPYYSTIYPPLAQAAFFLAHAVRPFSIDALRLVFLGFDAAALWLLIAALRAAGRSPLFAAAYWWCPLTTFTAFNTAHMDVLLAPFLAAIVLCMQQRWTATAGAAIACAAAVKLWPVALAPIVFRRLRKNLSAMVVVGACTIAAAALLCWPMLFHVGDAQSGLSAYAQHWRRFSLLFPLMAGAFGVFADDADLVARLAAAAIIVAASLALAFSRRLERGAKKWNLPFIETRRDHENLRPAGVTDSAPDGLSDDAAPAALLMLAALLFVLSPTGYPWYAAWFTVFLPFAPSRAAAALTIGLPLYYLRFPLSEAGLDWVTDLVLAPVAFGGPLVYFAVNRYRQRADGFGSGAKSRFHAA